MHCRLRVKRAVTGVIVKNLFDLSNCLWFGQIKMVNQGMSAADLILDLQLRSDLCK